MKQFPRLLILFAFPLMTFPVFAGNQSTNTPPTEKTATQFSISDYPELQAIQNRMEAESQSLLKQYQQGGISEEQMRTRKKEIIARYALEMKTAKQSIIQGNKTNTTTGSKPTSQASPTTKPSQEISKDTANQVMSRVKATISEVRTRVQSDASMDANAKNRILTQINKHEGYMNQQQGKLDKSTSQAQVTAIAVEVKNYWKTNQSIFQDVKQSQITSRSKQPLDQIEKTLVTMEKRLADAKKLGYNTVTAESLMSDAKQSMNKAKTQYEWVNKQNMPTNDALRTQLKQRTQEMTESMKQAVIQIKAAIKNLNNQPMPTK